VGERFLLFFEEKKTTFVFVFFGRGGEKKVLKKERVRERGDKETTL